MTTATIQPTREQPVYTDFHVRAPEAMRFVFASDDETGSTLQRDALLLYPYVAQGELTTGRVAEIIGWDRLSVMDFYEKKKLPWLHYGIEDLQHDLDTMRRLGILKEGQ